MREEQGKPEGDKAKLKRKVQMKPFNKLLGRKGRHTGKGTEARLLSKSPAHK